jgi:uncharacterized FlaG/YvyC family protein
MPNYYIFGSENIHFDINKEMNIVRITIKDGSSNLTIEEFERSVQNLAKYLEDLKEWEK